MGGKMFIVITYVKKSRLDGGAFSFFWLQQEGRDMYMWKWRKVKEQAWFGEGKREMEYEEVDHAAECVE